MKKANRIIAAFIIAIIAFLFSITLPWPSNVAMLPRLLLILIGILGVVLLITGGGVNEQKIADEKKSFKGILYSRLIVTIIATIIYIKATDVLGFYSATFVFLSAMFLYIGLRKKMLFIIVPAGVLACLYGIFSLWLRVPIPRGILF